MTNQSGLPFRMNIVPSGDVGHNGDVGQAASEPLSKAIAGLLFKHWVDEDPGEKCFDHDEVRTKALLSFFDGTSTGEGFEDVREHLIVCPRCRFLYGRLRDELYHPTGSDSQGISPRPCAKMEAVPELLSKNLRSTGPVVFPGGEVSDGAWEFGRMGELEIEVAEQIANTVATRAWVMLRGSLPPERIVIVCFSQPMHRCGKRLATTMVEANIDDVHVVMADDFFAPKLWCDPLELHERHVLVLVDVVHSGGLLGRLYAVCREAEPTTLAGIAVVDQSSGTAGCEPLCSLWQEPQEERISSMQAAQENARFFDPAAALAHRLLPQEVADPAKARATVENHLSGIGPIVPYIAATGALRRDARIGGVCYPWAVDLLRLLRDDEARAEFADRAFSCLYDLSDRGPWCLVYPASRFRRAGVWAELIAGALGWTIVKIGLESRTHYRPLTTDQRRALGKCRRAVIVDAAIRTGKTLQSLVGVLRDGSVPAVTEIAAFYAFDGLFREPRQELERNLNVEVRSLFRLPLGAPTEPVGQHCRRRLTATLEEIDAANGTAPPAWVEAIRAYCTKKLDPAGRPAKPPPAANTHTVLRRAIDEGQRGTEARLEHACDPPRSSLVKHLDVAYALREPRTRNVLHGFLCNSMPPDFIEWCALALATQKDYDWFDRDWLMLHKRLLTNSASARWQFLVCVAYWIRRDGNAKQIRRVRAAIDDFRRTEVSNSETLFPSLAVAPESPESLKSRCDTLLAVLSPT